MIKYRSRYQPNGNTISRKTLLTLCWGSYLGIEGLADKIKSRKGRLVTYVQEGSISDARRNSRRRSLSIARRRGSLCTRDDVGASTPRDNAGASAPRADAGAPAPRADTGNLCAARPRGKPRRCETTRKSLALRNDAGASACEMTRAKQRREATPRMAAQRQSEPGGWGNTNTSRGQEVGGQGAAKRRPWTPNRAKRSGLGGGASDEKSWWVEGPAR